MGWTLLHIAFGAVAVWLLAEVLLQYKARLRWRLLAFGGFALVVVGVELAPSLPLIALGAAAFAVGQTFVTLSYRRGFTAGWAIAGLPGVGGRREVRPMPPEETGPRLEVTDLRAEETAEKTGEQPAYRPEPLPDDTGQYGIYARESQPGEREPGERYAEYGAADGTGGGQDGYGGQYGYGYGTGEGQDGQYAAAGTSGYPGSYGDGTGTPGQPAYDDLYATAADSYQAAQGVQSAQGAQGYASYPDYPGGYGNGGYDDGGYGTGYGTGYGADPYTGAQQQPYGQNPSDVPPGEVWVPQQRDTEPQPQPGQYGDYGTGGGPDGYGDQYGRGPDGEGGYDTPSGTGYYYGDQSRW
ncbi:hypothetical protein V1L54_28650 [Streptomyces sp. TRM 70361]|uniref:hypothetical protein n=1 Tax=Streptomyces sp. TRM 70361 TaxID=3116553 RepID=UPI002E7BF08C|nr:hypothetical protein [Streptomyces sp. TRM 70361]MEE1943327.1 hypothetical protein [Streptomyces sp. TRM 70361]